MLLDTQGAGDEHPHREHATPIQRSKIPHEIVGEKRLVSDLLIGARTDLRRPVSCARHQLARAWAEDVYSCGCPYEAAGVEFGDVAMMMRLHPDELRLLLLDGVPQRAIEARCRSVPEAIELPASLRSDWMRR